MNKLKIIHVKKYKSTSLILNDKPLFELTGDVVGYEFIDKGIGCLETGSREMYLKIKKANGDGAKIDIDEVEYEFIK